MPSSNFDQEIEDFIRDAFEENYEQLRVESGRAITPDVKETALNQAILYWRKLREVAENITDTEVRLSFPNNSTPSGRNFSIEGVVDLLRDGDQTLMYDIKTHDADTVRANLSLYEQQLNVYAFIWHELRKQDLDGMAIIATNRPNKIGTRWSLLGTTRNTLMRRFKSLVVSWTKLKAASFHRRLLRH
jgi:hypothetical protein